MASQTQIRDFGTDQPASAQVTEPSSLIYSRTCVLYMFLGKRIRGVEDVSTIWMRMTRADLDSAYTFKKSLTQYIECAIDLGMTHYYPYFGDIMIFPVPFPLQGQNRRLFVLRTEPSKDGQMYSLLPEDCDTEFPANFIVQNLVEGNPLKSPCRQAEYLRREGYETSEQVWVENFEKIKRLLEMAQREELPPELPSFTLVIGTDPHAVENTGRGAWAARRLGPLLTKEYLEFANRGFAMASSGATVNGWH